MHEYGGLPQGKPLCGFVHPSKHYCVIFIAKPNEPAMLLSMFSKKSWI
jgi:hypothetical protein